MLQIRGGSHQDRTGIDRLGDIYHAIEVDAKMGEHTSLHVVVAAVRLQSDAVVEQGLHFTRQHVFIHDLAAARPTNRVDELPERCVNSRLVKHCSHLEQQRRRLLQFAVGSRLEKLVVP